MSRMCAVVEYYAAQEKAFRLDVLRELDGVTYGPVRLERLYPIHIPEFKRLVARLPADDPMRPPPARFMWGWVTRNGDWHALFAVRAQTDGQLLGYTGFHEFKPHSAGLSCGPTWLAPRFRGKGWNTPMKLALLAGAFERLHAARVQFLVETGNRRSMSAMLKLGATLEGVLRCSGCDREGQMIDQAVFSIIHTQWPAVKATTEARLESKQ